MKVEIDIDNIKDVKAYPYIYNMEEVMNISDLIVSRSGAMTIAHLAPAAVSGCPPCAPVSIPSEPTTTLQLKFTSTSSAARMTKSSLLTTAPLLNGFA